MARPAGAAVRIAGREHEKLDHAFNLEQFGPYATYLDDLEAPP